MREESNTSGGVDLRQTPSADAASGVSRAQPPRQSAPAPILLTDEQAAHALGVSVRKFHELRHQSWIPRPVALGPRLLRWHRAELEAAISSMPRQPAAAEPAQLARARIERMKQTGVPA